MVFSVLLLIPFFFVYINKEEELHQPSFISHPLIDSSSPTKSGFTPDTPDPKIDFQPDVTARDQISLAASIFFLWLLVCTGTYAAVWTIARTVRWVYRGFKKS